MQISFAIKNNDIIVVKGIHKYDSTSDNDHVVCYNINGDKIFDKKRSEIDFGNTVILFECIECDLCSSDTKEVGITEQLIGTETAIVKSYYSKAIPTARGGFLSDRYNSGFWFNSK